MLTKGSTYETSWQHDSRVIVDDVLEVGQCVDGDEMVLRGNRTKRPDS